jgi:phosphate:Na+ symporter
VGSEELREVHEEVLKSVQLEITNFSADGMVKSKARDKMIDSIRDLAKESIAKHRQRLSNRKSNSMSTSSIHQDTLRDLMQVVNLIENIKMG